MKRIRPTRQRAMLAKSLTRTSRQIAEASEKLAAGLGRTAQLAQPQFPENLTAALKRAEEQAKDPETKEAFRRWKKARDDRDKDRVNWLRWSGMDEAFMHEWAEYAKPLPGIRGPKPGTRKRVYDDTPAATEFLHRTKGLVDRKEIRRIRVEIVTALPGRGPKGKHTTFASKDRRFGKALARLQRAANSDAK